MGVDNNRGRNGAVAAGLRQSTAISLHHHATAPLHPLRTRRQVAVGRVPRPAGSAAHAGAAKARAQALGHGGARALHGCGGDGRPWGEGMWTD